MFTVTFRIIRKGISEVWDVTDSWAECMRLAQNAGAVEIIDYSAV